MNHGKALAIVVAYDIYKECCSGMLDPSWASSTVDFHTFRERLAVQMLGYFPKHLKYKSDKQFKVSTQVLKVKRRNRSSVSVARQ